MSETAEQRLERARTAARKFAEHFQFPEAEREKVNDAPIQDPLVIHRNGVEVEVFRWLGHGRGAPTIQVELDRTTGEATVYGGFEHREVGPWKPDGT